MRSTSTVRVQVHDYAMNKSVQTILVVLGAISVTTLSLQASDYVRMTGQLALFSEGTNSVCPVGMTVMNISSGTLCVDIYEASPSDACPQSVPQTEVDTQVNIHEHNCVPQTMKEVIPWRFVSLAQAQQLCARVDKRVPTATEWYDIALSLTDDTACVVNSNQPQPTGTAACLSRAGVHDLVGNVWEWVHGQTEAGQYNNRAVPQTGFVSQVDTAGIVIDTATVGQSEYGNDYAQTNRDGSYGIVRGGFYGSGEDAGIYAQNLAVPFDLKTAGIGFRCVRSL